MSSGPKRRGCDVCRKRHVKCDRQTPSCSQCIKAGWTCPGYASDFAFVNYSQEFPSGRARSSADETALSSRKSSPSVQTTSESSTGRVPLSRLQPRPSSSSSSSSLAFSTPADILRNQFASALENGSLGAYFEAMSIEACVSHLRPLIGKYPAMDDAVKLVCLASALPPRERDADTSTDGALIAAHAAALKSLREALADRDLVKSTGTLAASLLLRMYEVNCDPQGPARTFHAQGLSQLIQYRGPDCFQSETDLALFEGSVLNIIYGAMSENKECFAAEPEWRDVWVKLAAGSSPLQPRRMQPQHLDLANAWCCIPGAQAAFHDLVDREAANAGRERTRESMSPPPLSRTSPDNTSLEDYLVAHRHRLRAWWSQHACIPPKDTSGPWPLTNGDLVVHTSSAFQIICMNYMLATVAPAAASLEYDLKCPGVQRNRHYVDLGPQPYDLPSGLVDESQHLAFIIRKYCESQPDHRTFTDEEGRMSIFFAWQKTKDHPAGVISKESLEIAESLDWAFTARASNLA